MSRFRIECQYCKKEYDHLLTECPHCGVKRNESDVSDVKNLFVVSYIKQIILALLGSLGFIGISTLVSLIAVLITGVNAASPDNEKIMVIASTNFISYGILFLGLVGTINKDIVRCFPSFKKGIAYGAAVLGVLALLAFELIYGIILKVAGYNNSGNANQNGLESIIKIYPILSIVIFGIAGPICEELTYRVGLFSFFKRFNKWLPYVITILVFALIHFDFEALFDFGNPNYAANVANEFINLPAYLFAGAVFSFLYDKFGFAASVTAHIGNNLYSILLSIIVANLPGVES